MRLADQLREHFRILPTQARGLHKLGIETIRDLLYHLPTRYQDTSEQTSISALRAGDSAVLVGTISKLKTKKAFRKKIPMAEGVLEDASGHIKIVWFHQAYLAKMIAEGASVRVEGKVSERNGELYLSNPKIEPAPDLFHTDVHHGLYPIYPETRGISSNWIHQKIIKILSSEVLKDIADPIPENILKTYKLPHLRNALIYIHTPKKLEDAEVAKKRFAFQEIFLIQLGRARDRHELESEPAFKIDKSKAEIQKFTNQFPFQLTQGQEKVIQDILQDMQGGHPMSRLLEGDVGSGKTAVAATATYAVATSRPLGQDFGTLQIAYMAPTEILAKQHFESFIQYFKHTPGINVALITGAGARKFPSKVNPGSWTDISRPQLKKWVANGEISIVIGTHALIQKSVKFKHLGLVIIDEQHRFGTAQRQKLANKEDRMPHLLSMTATPIPRTLALTIYGDLDLSLLEEMPSGRKKIITKVITHDQRPTTYDKIREELEAGRQLYVICPRIDEPDPDKEMAVQAKSVKAEAKRLKSEVFPQYNIGILHSKMKPAEKEGVMLDFKDKKIDILVATSVVEVGVNVENASVIVIEGAERFGLAQLHQLRGRVLRGTHQPYCYVFTDTSSTKASSRLSALEKAKNGFELAEFDLAERGAGVLAGAKQWGISDIGMEAIKNIKMVEAARKEASELISQDPTLSKHPLLQAHLDSQTTKIHFE